MMSANHLAVAAASAGHSVSDRANPVPVERRKRKRSRVHWPILLFRHRVGEDAVRTVTRDLSSSGFYCVSKTAFVVGERLLCALHVPLNGPGNEEHRLECSVVVVRVDA